MINTVKALGLVRKAPKAIGGYYKGVGKSIKANPGSHLEVASTAYTVGEVREHQLDKRRSTHTGIATK